MPGQREEGEGLALVWGPSEGFEVGGDIVRSVPCRGHWLCVGGGQGCRGGAVPSGEVSRKLSRWLVGGRCVVGAGGDSIGTAFSCGEGLLVGAILTGLLGGKKTDADWHSLFAALCLS